MKPHSGNKIKAIGIMSGTSLDGMDLAACEFELVNSKWSFQICDAETISYSEEWEKRLINAPLLSGLELTELHSAYGKFIGKTVNKFIKKTGFSPDLIASHGHTVFHQPEKGFTLQIGNGAEILATTQKTTVADFRTADVALGGQGAPLVPIGDQYLFSEYDYCLNLGGFANVSYQENEKRIAFDNCPVNIVLNHYAQKLGIPYDKGGVKGKSGNVNTALLKKLNKLPYYLQSPPKSLGREWVETVFFPLVESSPITDLDKLRTIYEHIAIQIAKISKGEGKLLITGGGAFNSFLVERIKDACSLEVTLPNPQIIDFKEALIFAFLGVLKMQNKVNCLSSVTGASQDSSGGIIFKNVE